MQHTPIRVRELTLIYPHKTCFEGFCADIPYGSRIAIIGPNGSGKSSLLKMLHGSMHPTSGQVHVPKGLRLGYLPQILDTLDSKSGGERTNSALSVALAGEPDGLLLDEPTNHLDPDNRASLLRKLTRYPGTLVVVSHDLALLESIPDTLWYIDHGKIIVFCGRYADFVAHQATQAATLHGSLAALDRAKKDSHSALMQEQVRSAKSRAKGEKSIAQRKWPTIVSNAKARRAENTSGRKKAAIAQKKSEVLTQLSELYVPEVIVPKFHMQANLTGQRLLVAIQSGSVGYDPSYPILSRIDLSIQMRERVAIVGANGSGKSTLIKGILGAEGIWTSPGWHHPRIQDIGYLDQHYQGLRPEASVLESIAALVPDWKYVDLRHHLCDFLFRKNEEVNALVSTLSGGEKVRLSLAQIAAKTPKILILDELSNNLDLATRAHVIQVMRAYPGAIVCISHDQDFLKEMHIDSTYSIQDGRLFRT